MPCGEIERFDLVIRIGREEMKIENRAFTLGELEIISAANNEVEEIKKLIRAAHAAISQKATFQADINYAKRLLLEALEEPYNNPNAVDRSSRSVSCKHCTLTPPTR